MNKNELRKNVIKELKKKLGKNNMPSTDIVIEKLNETIMTRMFSHISPDTLKEVMKDVIIDYVKESKEDMPVKVNATFNERPKWYKDPIDTVKIEKMPQVKIEGVVKTKSDITDLADLLTVFFKNLVDFISTAVKGTFKVVLNKEHYITPQFMLLLDPQTMKPINPKDIGLGTMQQTFQSYSRGPTELGIRGANSIGDGTSVVTTAGTRVQMPTQKCVRVMVQSAPTNTGEMVIGGANVIASAGTRRGLALQSSQWQEFQVDNLNKLYIDSTVSGDKINYIYEYND